MKNIEKRRVPNAPEVDVHTLKQEMDSSSVPLSYERLEKHGWTAPFRAWPDPHDKVIDTIFQSYRMDTSDPGGRYLIVVSGLFFRLFTPPPDLRPHI